MMDSCLHPWPFYEVMCLLALSDVSSWLSIHSKAVYLEESAKAIFVGEQVKHISMDSSAHQIHCCYI